MTEREICILIALAGAVVQIILGMIIGKVEGKKAARDAFNDWRGSRS